jgi:hypothetical protein
MAKACGLKTKFTKMEKEKTKKERLLDAVCWIVIAAATIYFSVRIAIGIISKWYIIFP